MGVAGAEVVDVEAKVAVVGVAWAQEEILSALVAEQEQTRKRLLIKLSSSTWPWPVHLMTTLRKEPHSLMIVFILGVHLVTNKESIPKNKIVIFKCLLSKRNITGEMLQFTQK